MAAIDYPDSPLPTFSVASVIVAAMIAIFAACPLPAHAEDSAMFAGYAEKDVQAIFNQATRNRVHEYICIAYKDVIEVNRHHEANHAQADRVQGEIDQMEKQRAEQTEILRIYKEKADQAVRDGKNDLAADYQKTADEAAESLSSLAFSIDIQKKVKESWLDDARVQKELRNTLLNYLEQVDIETPQGQALGMYLITPKGAEFFRSQILSLHKDAESGKKRIIQTSERGGRPFEVDDRIHSLVDLRGNHIEGTEECWKIIEK